MVRFILFLGIWMVWIPALTQQMRSFENGLLVIHFDELAYYPMESLQELTGHQLLMEKLPTAHYELLEELLEQELCEEMKLFSVVSLDQLNHFTFRTCGDDEFLEAFEIQQETDTLPLSFGIDFGDSPSMILEKVGIKCGVKNGIESILFVNETANTSVEFYFEEEQLRLVMYQAYWG